MSAATTANLGRIGRASAYLEPDLYTIAQQEAERRQLTFSAWLRKVVVDELARQGKLPEDVLLRLVAGA